MITWHKLSEQREARHFFHKSPIYITIYSEMAILKFWCLHVLSDRDKRLLFTTQSAIGANVSSTYICW